MLGDQAQDGAAGADLEVVGVGADGQDPERPVRRAVEAECEIIALRSAPSRRCQTAHGGAPGLELGLEDLDVLERVHRRPEPVVRIGLQLVASMSRRNGPDESSPGPR